MGMMHKLRRFGALSAADKWLWLRAVTWLGIARIELAALPFDRLVARLSAGAEQGSATADPELLRRVRFAISSAAANVPWRSDCFPQAIAARAMLKRYDCSPTIHLGIERSGDDALLGHAWLTCDDEIVTGGGGLDRYTEIHRFNG
jgi:hypothetical protein